CSSCTGARRARSLQERCHGGRMTLHEAETYFMSRVADLKRMTADGTPWVFLCGSAFIEYLSKLADGKDGGAAGFKRLINTYMLAGYRTFKYKSGVAGLPEQLYHVLRCGIVHSFSLIPNRHTKRKGGRDRSVVLSHDEPHLTQYSSVKAP